MSLSLAIKGPQLRIGCKEVTNPMFGEENENEKRKKLFTFICS